jgi:uridine monophosphate synthetase
MHFQKLQSAGLVVHEIVVLIDRGQGATEVLANAGYRMHAVTTLPRLLKIWRETGAITEEQYVEVSEFLASSK